jgi:hypothetical protein
MVNPSLALVPLLVLLLVLAVVCPELLLAAADGIELPLSPHAASDTQARNTRTADTRVVPIMEIPFNIDALLVEMGCMRK